MNRPLIPSERIVDAEGKPNLQFIRWLQELTFPAATSVKKLASVVHETKSPDSYVLTFNSKGNTQELAAFVIPVNSTLDAKFKGSKIMIRGNLSRDNIRIAVKKNGYEIGNNKENEFSLKDSDFQEGDILSFELSDIAPNYEILGAIELIKS